MTDVQRTMTNFPPPKRRIGSRPHIQRYIRCRRLPLFNDYNPCRDRFPAAYPDLEGIQTRFKVFREKAEDLPSTAKYPTLHLPAFH
jgi:hypothetical protein